MVFGQKHHGLHVYIVRSFGQISFTLTRSHPPHPHTLTTLTGLQLLRSKPKKGVRFLQEKGLVGREAEEVAAFFHRDERVNRAAIGDYLGESDE